MRSLIYCFFLGLLVTAALSGDLKIKTITKPDKCYPTARTGDTIEVHYIGNYHVSRQFVKFVGPGCEIREDDIIEVLFTVSVVQMIRVSLGLGSH